jgi:5'-3' exonuclease
VGGQRKWLLIDVSCLAYRALYSTGSLSTTLGMGELETTGTLYGILAEVKRLYNRFGSHNMLFCFDWRKPWRRLEIYPAYKRNRLPSSDPIIESARAKMHPQIQKLREEVLPALGFPTYYEDGYEADDLIAALYLNVYDPVVLVSSDHDLYQLLDRKTVQWSPQNKDHNKSCFTVDDLAAKYGGLQSHQWPEVKAIAGCPTDNIQGCFKVAEILASRFVLGRLPKTTLAYKNILRFRTTEQYITNLRLVELPFDGLEAVDIPRAVAPKENPFESGQWDGVVGELGFDSLRFKREGRVAIKRSK